MTTRAEQGHKKSVKDAEWKPNENFARPDSHFAGNRSAPRGRFGEDDPQAKAMKERHQHILGHLFM